MKKTLLLPVALLFLQATMFAQSNVGIGTNSPGSKASVNGNLSVGSSYSTVTAPADGAIIEGNVGVGTNNPQTKLDVRGSLSFREGTALSLSNGQNDNVTLTGDYSFYRITGPTSAFSISGFQNGIDGKVVTVYNTTGQALTFLDQSTGSTGANRLKTLSSKDYLSGSGDAAITLQYNSTDQRWIVIGSQNMLSINDWHLSGNKAVTGTQYIGTADNSDLSIKTNGANAIVINGSTQNVGIGSTPNASALLDINSSNKGISFPNVALASSTDNTTIASPKTGLMVFNPGTGGLSPAGVYINTGTSGSPTWLRLSDSNSGIQSIGIVSPLQSTGGVNPTLSIPQANGSTNGFLSSSDWNTFNGKLSTSLGDGNIWVGNSSNIATQRTPGGDLTMNNTGSYTLNTSGVTASTYGSSTQAPVINVDAKGRITSALSTTISGTTPGGSAGGDLTGSYPSPTLATSGVAANTYGSATQTAVIAVDAKGRITSASNTTIAGVAPAGTAGGDLNGTYPNPTVDGLQGNAISATAPTTTNNILAWNGTAWAPANKGVPSGAIMMWSGTIAAIPAGWVLCDGNNGTPNLLDKFVVNVPNATTNPGTTGGSHSITLSVSNLPAHTHTGTTDAAGAFTPAGTISAVSAGTPAGSLSSDGAGTPAGTISAVTAGTPAGSLSSDGAGTPAGTISAVTAGTPAGTISAVTAGTPAGTIGAESAHTHGVGTLATASAGSHSHSFSQISDDYWGNTYYSFQGSYGGNSGQIIGFSTDAAGAHTHTMTGSTAAGSSHTHSFTGTALGTHTHTFTGTALATHIHTFAGTALAAHTHTFTGTAMATHAHTFTGTALAAHTHTFTGTALGTHTHTFTGTAVAAHTHTFTTASTGSGTSFDNRPAFFTLAYIMKQ